MADSKKAMGKIVIAAGGTGGHIFPALSLALAWREKNPESPLLWIGTTRNREQELCSANNINLVTLDVSGVQRKLSFDTVKAIVRFVKAWRAMLGLMRVEQPAAVVAFGGYVSAPVLLAARMSHVPYFLHEQNTVPGLVNRLFSDNAVCSFLSMPLNGRWSLKGTTKLVGLPVRQAKSSFDPAAYPAGFDKNKKTVLITCGSQGALTVDRLLAGCVNTWANEGLQVVWHTGEAGFQEIKEKMGQFPNVFVYSTIPDLYPFYAVSRAVIGRAGASTLAEAAYFGLPIIMIPLPWATENHQWKNAGLVETQGWGIRIKQDENAGRLVDKYVRLIINDPAQFEKMSGKAVDNSPANAASAMVQDIVDALIK